MKQFKEDRLIAEAYYSQLHRHIPFVFDSNGKKRAWDWIEVINRTPGEKGTIVTFRIGLSDFNIGKSYIYGLGDTDNPEDVKAKFDPKDLKAFTNKSFMDDNVREYSIWYSRRDRERFEIVRSNNAEDIRNYWMELTGAPLKPENVSFGEDNWQFFTESVNYTIDTSFNALPEKAPYGFLVWRDGAFTTIKTWAGHDAAIQRLNTIDPKSPRSAEGFFQSGGVRMAISADMDGYYCDYEASTVTNAAKKTMKDLPKYYGLKAFVTDSHVMDSFV